MLQILKLVAFVAPVVFWFYLTDIYGIRGSDQYAILAFAVATGVALGYYDLPHGLSRRITPKWRTVGVVAMLLATTVSFLFAGRGETGRRDSSATAPDVRFADQPAGEPAPTSDIVATKKPDLAKSYQDIAEESKGEGVKIGVKRGIEREREAISKRPRPIARTESELQLNPIGPGQWSIPFRMPGISRIDFGSQLDFPLGKTYYLSTMGPIPNLQVGWIDDRNDGKFATPPTSEFSPRNPLRYWMGTETALNARVVFLTETVPPGEYEIIVVESALALGPREQAPGVHSKRFYEAQ
jgi:hypothetical protein